MQVVSARGRVEGAPGEINVGGIIDRSKIQKTGDGTWELRLDDSRVPSFWAEVVLHMPNNMVEDQETQAMISVEKATSVVEAVATELLQISNQQCKRELESGNEVFGAMKKMQTQGQNNYIDCFKQNCCKRLRDHESCEESNFKNPAFVKDTRRRNMWIGVPKEKHLLGEKKEEKKDVEPSTYVRVFFQDEMELIGTWRLSESWLDFCAKWKLVTRVNDNAAFIGNDAFERKMRSQLGAPLQKTDVLHGFVHTLVAQWD